MKKMKVAEVARLLSNYPSLGIKPLERPYVLVLKTRTGIVVSWQNEVMQKTKCIGKALFPENMLIHALIDVNFKKNKHFIVIAVEPCADKQEVEFYLIGGTTQDTEDVTAFLAYEMEKNKSIHMVTIIEDNSDRNVFSDARRYGSNSQKLLKAQLRMFMALAGIDSATRNKIVLGGGFLPPAPTLEEEGLCDE